MFLFSNVFICVETDPVAGKRELRGEQVWSWNAILKIFTFLKGLIQGEESDKIQLNCASLGAWEHFNRIEQIQESIGWNTHVNCSRSVSEIKPGVVFGFLEGPELEKGLDLHSELFTVAPAQPNICLCLNNSSGKHLSRYLTSANRVSHTCSWIRARTGFNSKVKSSFPGFSPCWRSCEMGSGTWAWEEGCGLIFTLPGCPELPEVIPELLSCN